MILRDSQKPHCHNILPPSDIYQLFYAPVLYHKYIFIDACHKSTTYYKIIRRFLPFLEFYLYSYTVSPTSFSHNNNLQSHNRQAKEAVSLL